MRDYLLKAKKKIVSAFYASLTFIISHKITSAIIVSVIAAVLAATIVISSVLSTPKNEDIIYSNKSDVVSEIMSVPEISSEAPVSSVESAPSSVPVVSTPPTPTPTPAPTPQVNTEYNYNSDMSPYSNVFLDALKYTGYNLERERASGRMFASGSNYVLCSQKRGLGWLSEITYDDYGTASGFETNAQGLPDIEFFTWRNKAQNRKRGLVCASYATYVYFNYLPNVAGIDTSSLDRPAQSYNAHSWYQAAKQWVAKGYSRYIDFTASDGGSINNDLKIKPAEEIPIGSLILLTDWYNRSDHCSHICIYAGYVNGYHWVTHVGNENGPEFCAIERMNRKPHPQWMLKIVTTPSNIRFSASAEVKLQDDKGNGIEGVEFKIKDSAGKETVLGTTDKNGVVSKDSLAYGDYTLVHTAPAGYADDTTQMAIKLTTQNNSLNTFTLKIKKQEIKKEESNLQDSKQDNSSDILIPPATN